MGKQQARARKKQRAQDREQRRLERQAARAKPEVKRPYTLLDCMKLGRTANILFVVFIVICLIYYYSLARRGTFVIPFEIVAYIVETSAFVLFTLSVIWMDRLVRARGLMKILMLVYIVVEVVLMLLEFHFLPWTHYNGLNMWLTVAHSIFSGIVALSLLQLDPHNRKLQIIIILTSTVIFAGMFLGIAGYRVYGSILLNAIAYIVFYSVMCRQVQLEEMDIDCYGDRATTATYTSTMFADSPLLEEKPEKEKLTLRQHARRLKSTLQTEEEHPVLTDYSEKFEYEFSVQEDDDDDEYEDDEEYEDEDDGDEDGESS